MKGIYQLLFFLNAASMGLLTPVLSLVLLAHGAEIETLPLFAALFALTIILAELPSGVAADLFGRKCSFLLSHVFQIGGVLLMLKSQGPFLLAASSILRGLGSAFASGSLEALVIDQYKAERGLARINSQILLLESAGMAAGALLGGVLGVWGNGCRVLLCVRLGAEIFLFLLSLACINEERRFMGNESSRGQIFAFGKLMGEIRQSFGTAAVILMAAALVGSAQMVLEVYWQQNFISLVPGNMAWCVGVISSLGFLGVMLGNQFTGVWIARRPRKKGRIYWLFKFLLPGTVLFLGLCHSWLLFAALYILAYVILGAGEISEKVLLHQATADQCRAGMLSVYSLVIRIGGMVSSVLASFIALWGGLTAVWILLPAAALVCLLAVYVKCGFVD